MIGDHISGRMIDPSSGRREKATQEQCLCFRTVESLEFFVQLRVFLKKLPRETPVGLTDNRRAAQNATDLRWNDGAVPKPENRFTRIRDGQLDQPTSSQPGLVDKDDALSMKAVSNGFQLCVPSATQQYHERFHLHTAMRKIRPSPVWYFEIRS
ncbi:hypothetical protein BL253_27750 [Pseudofrankia asymbiotica]|uniref:Uncharacterized protein n=1 Tax=Pseudofrankia asymbiotica TaxID=1834516 RepID=A0A1V2I684_9ACTN|nr:hypothetical protein BL253_27750 [Pseudofrankia asymbiotica]